MKKRRLIVLSLDALVFEDLEYLKNKPTFKMLIEGGAMVERMRSIYPSLTYPCHITMATGCYPDKHGIVNNNYLSYVEDPKWIFEHENVRCEDILDVCKRVGYTTASVGWPVSGNHKSVDYLVNECWAEAGAPIEKYREVYIENGTPEWLYDELLAPIVWMRAGRKQPGVSYFHTQITASIIRKYKPDIVMMHQGNIDGYRHREGVFTDLVKTGLDECEEMVASIVQATRDAGVFEETNFVITADHGHLNITRRLNLNSVFRSMGYIDVNNDGGVKRARIWSQNTNMSAQIYLEDPEDKNLWDEAYSLLKRLRDEGVWGISEVYTLEECREMHLDGDFSFVVETDGATAFEQKWQGAYAVPTKLSLSGLVGGSHGFHPNKGPRPPFVAFGPAFTEGARIPDANLVDGAPTYAKVMGVELSHADGRVLSELLKNDR